MMPIIPAYAAIVVSMVYCAYEQVRLAGVRHKKEIHERVAALLWAVANRDDE